MGTVADLLHVACTNRDEAISCLLFSHFGLRHSKNHRLPGIVASALLVLLLVLARSAAAGGGAGVAEVPLSWELGVTGVGEGEADGFGFGGDGDTVVRRVLQNGNGYISYGTLRRDSVPCSVRGASYYNCRLGAQDNPYSRGCSAITRCRG